MVPTNRPVEFLDDCIRLASETSIPLIVVCSKRVKKGQVIDAAAQRNAEVFAVDLPSQQTNLLEGISFRTSTDEDLLAFTSGLTRDLSAKRNLGLVIAKMCGWERIMFLDDDIQHVSDRDVAALSAGLDDHNVSVLIPDEYPDNSVACHANRLGGGEQGKFASAGGMGVRCNRNDLSFFPNIYNEDWFFFSKEAANHKIAEVGRSQQRFYDPYADPKRAIKEELGDLLAEGLYARLDDQLDILSVDVAYWRAFIKIRKKFLREVSKQLAARLKEHNLNSDKQREIRAAQVSIRKARRQLRRIHPALCQKFIDLWQADLAEWHCYLTKLPRFESVEESLDHLRLEYAVSQSPSTR
jgi:glycosyltransferase involved in cell wall biosynthesis